MTIKTVPLIRGILLIVYTIVVVLRINRLADELGLYFNGQAFNCKERSYCQVRSYVRTYDKVHQIQCRSANNPFSFQSFHTYNAQLINNCKTV